MKKKRISRALAMLLALAMTFTMSSAIAFAAGDGDTPSSAGKEVNLVVFGNSTSSGYGMPDFYNTNNGFAALNNYLEDWALDADGVSLKGWGGSSDSWTDQTAWTLKAAQDWKEAGYRSLGRMSNAAFPWQMKKYLVAQGADKVNLTPYCLNGLRTDELRAFLDKDFYVAAKNREAEYTDKWFAEHGGTKENMTYGFLSAHMEWYLDNFADSKAVPERGDYDASREYVIRQLKDADVIVVDLCGNNFGTYLGYRLGAYLGMDKNRYFPNTYETLDDVNGLPAGLKDQIDSIIGQYAGGIAGNPVVKQLLDAYMYSVADCIVNFSADMEYINKLKKEDAKVIAVGLNNPMEGLKIAMGDKTIDFGEITGKLYGLINSYMKAVDGNSNNYYYADIPSGLTTFASTIANAESLGALLTDGNIEDGRGAYAIDRIYREFVNDFMGGSEGDSKTVYGIIQDGIKNDDRMKAQGAGTNFYLSFKGWDALGNDEPITIKPVSYITVDQEVIDAATDEDSMMAAFGVSAKNPDVDARLTENVVKKVAAKYKMSTLTDEEKAALAGRGLTTPEQIYAYILQNVNEDNIAETYSMIQGGIKNNGAPNANDFSDLSETETATFNPLGSELYLTVDMSAGSLMEAFGVYDGSYDNPTFLTKNRIRQLTAAKVKPLVQNMLYEALRNHQTLDIGKLQTSLADMDSVAAAIKTYMFAVMTGQDAELDEAYWGLLTLEEKFLLSDGIGEHPSAVGCNEKFEAVKTAYEKAANGGNTAYEDVKAEIAAKLAAVIEMLKQTGAKDDIEAIEAKLAEIQALIALVDESGLTPDDLREFLAMKDQFQAALEQTMDKMGITYDDLIEKGKLIVDTATTDEAIANLKKMDELIRQYPALKAKYTALAQKLLDELGLTVDDLIAGGKFIADAATSEEAIKALKDFNSLVQNYPALKAKYIGIAQSMLDELGLTVDDLIAGGKFIADAATSEGAIQAIKDLNWLIMNYPELKAKYMAIAQEMLDELGTTVEELIAQGKLIYDQVPEEEILAAVKAMTELAKSLPELRAEYQAYADEIFDALGITLDDVINAAKNIKDSTDIHEIADTIRTIRTYVEQIAAFTEQAKAAAAMVQEKIDLVNGMLEEMGLAMTGESLDELKAIAERLANAQSKEDFEEIVNDLLPIGMKLLNLGTAIATLPEYEEAVEAFKQASQEAQTGLEERVEALELQVAQLTARYVKVNITSKASFTSKAAKLTIKWVGDEDAAGYYLKIDGKDVGEIAGGKGDKTYDIPKAVYGKAYKVEVTPFVDYVPEEGAPQIVEGKTFTKSVTAKLATPKNKTPKKGKKSLKVKWGKVAGADGYQISLKAKGKKTKKVTVKGGSKVSKKVKKLAAKKKYTVKVRAYKTIGGKKYYSAWSKAKKAKTK